MSRFSYIVATGFFILLALSSPARSFETPVTDPNERQALLNFGKNFQSIASQFDCDELAWANSTTQNIIFEYIPRGDKVESWKRMVTVTIYRIPEQQEKDLKALNEIMFSLMNAYKSNGEVLNSTFYQNEKKEPAMFLEYTVGAGPLKEHSAGIFGRNTPITAVFIQVQSRGKPLSPEDIKTIQSTLKGQKE